MQKRADPCGEMGGFTRLLTTYSGRTSHVLHADEIPTFVVQELSGGSPGSYVVVNRPHSMVQFVKHPEFRRIVTEEYVYIAETDHVLLRPLPNLATPERPAGFNFGYMVAWGQAKIVDKFVPGLGGKTDPVGPSPVIIHVEQLKRMVQPWYDFTLKICKDHEAVQALGWVREMWGWCIAAGSLGIKHRVIDDFQYEGGSIGNRERPLVWPVAPTPVGASRPEMPYYVFHYTYGIEYSVDGLPMELQVGEWSLDKRHYMGGSPPARLLAPPSCAHDRAHVLTALFNNASAALGTSAAAGSQPDKYNRLDFRGHPLRSHDTASRLLGTGPWQLSGQHHGRSYRLESLWILANGWLVSRKGHGRWGLVPQTAGGYEEGVVQLKICAMTVQVRASFSMQGGSEGGTGTWTLTLAEGGQVIGKLEATAEALALWSRPPVVPADTLEARLEGSGPYQGLKAGSIMLLRAGVVHATGGSYNQYTAWRSLGGSTRQAVVFGRTDAQMRVRAGSSSPVSWLVGESDTVVADVTDCWILRFPQSGGEDDAKSAPPPKYGEGIAARQAEWIIRPAATMCVDACAGLTLRRLTAADREGSVVARSVEGCCGWSWAGFGGLQFLTGGELVTPWGKGVWGAPPEAQNARGGTLLADFAGHKHLLRVDVLDGAGGKTVATRMQSTRCTDNDRSTVALLSGKPQAV